MASVIRNAYFFPPQTPRPGFFPSPVAKLISAWARLLGDSANAKTAQLAEIINNWQIISLRSMLGAANGVTRPLQRRVQPGQPRPHHGTDLQARKRSKSGFSPAVSQAAS